VLQEPYTYKDLYVGAEVVINRFNFSLANADEYTISYMENNKHLFIMGDGNAVLKLLKAQVAVCAACMLDATVST
jgi:EF-hand domain-containing protein 1